MRQIAALTVVSLDLGKVLLSVSCGIVLRAFLALIEIPASHLRMPIEL
jgi:hypothetical protein